LVFKVGTLSMDDLTRIFGLNNISW
jgi:hypothetical protein